MKKIYIVCEYSDYGLVDMSEARAFDTFEAAETAAIAAIETKGWRLDIITLDIETGK
jgi:hypothetical protein